MQIKLEKNVLHLHVFLLLPCYFIGQLESVVFV